MTFEYDVPSREEFTGRMEHILARYPYLAAWDGRRLLGYAYAGAFHPRAAYGWSVETTVSVSYTHLLVKCEQIPFVKLLFFSKISNFKASYGKFVSGFSKKKNGFPSRIVENL